MVPSLLPPTVHHLQRGYVRFHFQNPLEEGVGLKHMIHGKRRGGAEEGVLKGWGHTCRRSVGDSGVSCEFRKLFFFLRDTVKSYSKADGIIYTWRVNWRYRELWENPGVSFIRMTQVNFDPLQWSCSHRAPCKKERYSKKSKVQMWKLGSISLT